MKKILDESKPNLKYFEEISRIPRPSFHEELIADYLVDFAKERGLWYYRDSIHNVIIKKDATPGRIDRAPIILQAHTDMVCVKTKESTHDFLKDPINIYVEDGFITAKDTTLGADDGAGVANILAALDDDTYEHPPLECVFTVQEEDGIGGAKGLDYSKLSAKRMIGLDGLREGTTIFCAPSVIGLEFSQSIARKEPEADSVYMKLEIGGLRSGHGASNIGDERANALKLTARILYHMKKKVSIRLVSLDGGTLANVIAREAETVFTCNISDLEEIQNVAGRIWTDIKEEYYQTDPDIWFSLTSIPPTDAIPMSERDSDSVIDFAYVMPHGLFSRNPEALEEFRASCNFSIMKTKHDSVLYTNVCRESTPLHVEELAEQVKAVAKPYTQEYRVIYDYVGHCVDKQSPMIKIYEDVYREHTGKELVRKHNHGGLDIGSIYQGMGGLDVIVLMPNTYNVHTVNEKVELESFIKSFQYLKDILERA